MGVPKALLDFRGQPFIVRILEVLEALEIKIRVAVLAPDVARVRAAIADHDCMIVENPDVDGGPIASLRVALRSIEALQPGAALVWPVDLPHVRVATIDRLLEARRRTAASIILPTFGTQRGHPIIWGAGLFGELLTSPAASTAGARAVLHSHEPDVAAVPVDDPAIIDRVNTPEDYERLVREWNRDAY